MKTKIKQSQARKTMAKMGAVQRCDAPLGPALLSQPAWAEVSRSLKMSGCELEIVRNVFDNKTEMAIADQLRVSEHTVHSHLNRLFKKLKVTTRTQMVLRVMQELLYLTVSEGGCLPPICRNHVNGRCCFKC